MRSLHVAAGDALDIGGAITLEGRGVVVVETCAGTGVLVTGQAFPALDLHHWDPEDFPKPGPIGASEAAGPVFTPDGKYLFVNVPYPGITCVVTGPWNATR